MFSEGSLQSFIPERVTINIRGGGGGRNKRSWLFKKSKINNPPPPHRLLGTEEYVNLHRNQVSPALGRIFITYMICPGFGLVICEKTCLGFGLSFGFHGVHPYQKNICSHPPPPPPRIVYTLLFLAVMLLILNFILYIKYPIHLAPYLYYA